MGLDISAYSRCVFVHGNEHHKDKWADDACIDSDLVQVYLVYPDYESQMDGLTEGCYRVEGQSTGFRAGSYGGYNRWREVLSRAALQAEPSHVWANPTNYVGKPGYELVNFSDSEGVIGPATSAKLARDLDGLILAEEWAEDLKNEWLQAFTLASDGGLVAFH